MYLYSLMDRQVQGNHTLWSAMVSIKVSAPTVNRSLIKFDQIWISTRCWSEMCKCPGQGYINDIWTECHRPNDRNVSLCSEVRVWVVVILSFRLLVMPYWHWCFARRFIQMNNHNKIILNSFQKGIWLWLLINKLSLMLEILIGFDGWHLHPQYYKIYITVFTP